MIRLLTNTEKHAGHHSITKKKMNNFGPELMFSSEDRLVAPREITFQCCLTTLSLTSKAPFRPEHYFGFHVCQSISFGLSLSGCLIN